MTSRETSSAQFTLLREWLRQCDYSHSCNDRTRTKAFLPTRLLFVGDTNNQDLLCLKLTTGMDGAKYIALSHRWGPPSDEKTKFCTTKDNIGHRLNGFSISDLPKTFQDAIRVTRELDAQYLWIDSLCIIQADDNGEDWKNESKLMESVFSSAYCTIAATSAMDMRDGFLARKASPEYQYVRSISGRRFYICAGPDDFELDVDKAELNTRAWVMQERVLSQRIIHFSANQMYWDCGQGVYCENLTKMERSRRKEYFRLDSTFPRRFPESESRSRVEFIHLLFEDYSKRHLTKRTDRAVAISGLHDRIADTLRCQGRYGIFEKHLHANLLWQASDSKLERIPYPGGEVPSWSWMAYTGGVQFIKTPVQKTPVQKALRWARNLQFDNERKSALIANVRNFRNCTTEPENNRHAIWGFGRVRRGWTQYDVEGIVDLCEMRCVCVGKFWERKFRGWKYYILVVRPTSVDGEYERIGLGVIEESCVQGEALNMRIV